MSQVQSDLQRDKTVTLAIHKLYWRAMLQTKLYFIFTLLCHAPAFFVIAIYIPLQVAYGLQAIITRQFDDVGHYAINILVATVIGNIVYAIGTWAFNRNGVYGASYVQRVVLANYLNKDYDFFSSNYIGSLGSNASNLRQAFTDYNRIFLFDIPRVVTVVIASLAVIAINSLTLALISIICMIFVHSTNILFSKHRLRYRRIVSKASTKLSGMLGDSLSHGPAVKSYAKEKYEQERIDPPLNEWERAQLKSWDWFTPQNFTRHMLLAVTMGLLLIVSARLYEQGAISIAIIALVQLYVIRLINSTIDASEIIKQYETMMGVSYEPIATMLVPTTIIDPEIPQKISGKKTYEISLENVTYHYPEAAKGSKAVTDFSLQIGNGEKIGLVGYSGGGKTTVTKLLLRFMDVDDGSIKIDGIDIRDVAQTDLRNVIAYVPQEPLLFHRSIKDNIAYARPEASNKQIEAAAKTAFVDEFVKSMPKGYDSMVGERGVKLSGGQRQRVAIARALLKDAPILVLDEATSALDSQSERYIQKALWELMKDRTAIVIAHRLSTIQHMDRIVVMDKGSIVEIGSHKELLKDKNGIYAKLWAHQSDGYLST